MANDLQQAIERLDAAVALYDGCGYADEQLVDEDPIVPGPDLTVGDLRALAKAVPRTARGSLALFAAEGVAP